LLLPHFCIYFSLQTPYFLLTCAQEYFLSQGAGYPSLATPLSHIDIGASNPKEEYRYIIDMFSTKSVNSTHGRLLKIFLLNFCLHPKIDFGKKNNKPSSDIFKQMHILKMSLLNIEIDFGYKPVAREIFFEGGGGGEQKYI